MAFAENESMKTNGRNLISVFRFSVTVKKKMKMLLFNSLVYYDDRLMCMEDDWSHCKEKNWLLTFTSILNLNSDFEKVRFEIKIRTEREKSERFSQCPSSSPWLWKRVDERWWLNQKDDLLCCFDSLLTDLWREHHCSIKHRQETAFCEAQFYSAKVGKSGRNKDSNVW